MKLLFSICLSIICSTFAAVSAPAGQKQSPIEGPVHEPVFEMTHPSRPEKGQEHEERVLVAGVGNAVREAKDGAWAQWPQWPGPGPMNQKFFCFAI